MTHAHITDARTARGFTLIEVMVATLVFSVGMMAIMSMEFSAISAYKSARDQTIATDLGYRAISLMRAESANWALSSRNAVVSGAVDSTNTRIDLDPVYSTDTPLDVNGAVIGKILESPWQWSTLTPQPVDSTMVPRAAGRYCVYVRGAPSSLVLGGGVANVESGGSVNTSPLIQTQIAIVYPNNKNSFDGQGCQQFPGCPNTTPDLLRPSGADTTQSGVDALPPLALCGYGAVYMGAMISRSSG